MAAEELPGKSNYLIGNDPSAWHVGVANYARVRVEGVYEGIDVDVYGTQQPAQTTSGWRRGPTRARSGCGSRGPS